MRHLGLVFAEPAQPLKSCSIGLVRRSCEIGSTDPPRAAARSPMTANSWAQLTLHLQLDARTFPSVLRHSCTICFVSLSNGCVSPSRTLRPTRARSQPVKSLNHPRSWFSLSGTLRLVI